MIKSLSNWRGENVMRTFGKWLGRILLMLILAAAVVGFMKREELMRLMAVNSLFAEDKIVHNFSNMNGAFLSREVAHGDAAAVDEAFHLSADHIDGTGTGAA